MSDGTAFRTGWGAAATTAAVRDACDDEPYARKLGMRCLEVAPGFSRVEMVLGEDMVNFFGIGHGGAVFSLIDTAFETACNSHGTMALALNVNITYISATKPGDRLTAEAKEESRTPRTATYEVRVTRETGELVALAQALAYRKKELLPFLPRE
ncbi:MAG: hotdog fold thioesterase [Deltaproteobacteria bacterium]|nr:hotdog fold thioesterase [Deltaproteobacteria bacterium]